jgi:hypothetical protein
LRSFTSRIENGENSINPDMTISSRDILIVRRYRARRRPQSWNPTDAKGTPPASHAILGWHEASGSDTRVSNNSRMKIGGGNHERSDPANAQCRAWGERRAVPEPA